MMPPFSQESMSHPDDSPTQALAIHGGEPVFPDGPPAWPIADEDVHAALERAYADGSWGRYDGPHLQLLTTALQELHGIDFVGCCSSGTIAVELALRGLKITAGDEVILAGYDFSGNFRAIEAVGAVPVLIDIDPQTWCLAWDQVQAAIGPRVRAVIASHLHGGLVPMRQLCEIAREASIAIIEDACQAPGAMVQGRRAGTWGDVGVLSFGGSKLLTAGRGGAVLTPHPDVFQRIKVFCERGNHAFPLSELQAAVLLPQIQKLLERNRRRQENARRLIDLSVAWANLQPLQLLTEIGAGAYFKLPWLFCPQDTAHPSRDAFLAAIQAEGVALDAGFRGFAGRTSRRCRKVGSLAASQNAADQTVVLHHPILLEDPATIDRVAYAISKVLAGLAARS
jgi:perosamine synthetase